MSAPAPLARREDWPERLQEVLDRHAALPFGWGSSDCVLMPADCVLAMTGWDPAAPIRGRYRTALGAAGHLRKRGFRSVAEVFETFFPEIPVSLAGRGDLGIVAVPTGTGFAGAVFMGAGAFGKAEGRAGNLFVPRGSILRAFQV